MIERPPVIDIFLTMFKYPEMLELVVESINKARKPRDYRIWGIFEFGFLPELEEIFDRIIGVETKKIKRSSLYGIDWNTPASFMEVGKATLGEYVVQLQSDIVISSDFFEFIDYVMTNWDVGYTLAYGVRAKSEDESAIAIQCRTGWYGHWGSGVKTSVLRDIYPKYLTDEYRTERLKYSKRLFPEIGVGGSDFFINAFLLKEGVRGARPFCSRCTNIGIDGEHIRLHDNDKKKWNAMPREEKLAVLRDIIDNGVYRLKTNIAMNNVARIRSGYHWNSLYETEEVLFPQKFTGTDI